MGSEAERAERARLRGVWPIRTLALEDEGSEPVPTTGSTAERWARMWDLTLTAWAFSGRPLPSYERSRTPLRLLRRGPNERASGRPKDLADLAALDDDELKDGELDDDEAVD